MLRPTICSEWSLVHVGLRTMMKPGSPGSTVTIAGDVLGVLGVQVKLRECPDRNFQCTLNMSSSSSSVKL